MEAKSNAQNAVGVDAAVWAPFDIPATKDLLIPRSLRDEFKVYVRKRNNDGHAQRWDLEPIGKYRCSCGCCINCVDGKLKNEKPGLKGNPDALFQREDWSCGAPPVHARGSPETLHDNGLGHCREGQAKAEPNVEEHRTAEPRDAASRFGPPREGPRRPGGDPGRLADQRSWGRRPFLTDGYETDSWVAGCRDRAMNEISYLPTFDPSCPYCSMLDQEAKSVRDGVRSSVRVIDPRGRAVRLNQAIEGPGERVKAGAQEECAEVKIWNANEHTVINIDKIIIDCVPKSNNVITSAEPDVQRWKEAYHHQHATQVGDCADCFVAYTKSKPKTHVWAKGYCLHFEEAVSLSFCNP